MNIPFGPYELLRRIAAGGMGEVYLARRAGLEGFEKLLAVKVLLPYLVEDEDLTEMFLNEARIAARLNHANIAQIFDLGEVDGAYYIAMEYIHGEDVKHIWKKARKEEEAVPLPLAARVAADVSAGLDYAHKATGPDDVPLGIIHRDVSPPNILVTFDGEVKVIDFGIAKATGRNVHTATGTLKGKYPYMSPEQVASKSLDHRSDIFALGAVLFEMVTGRRLFAQGSEREILNAVAECEVPSPSRFNPDIDEQLERIVLTALKRDPEDRFEDAQEMRLALEDWLTQTRQRGSAAHLGTYLRKLYEERLAEERAGKRAVTESDPPPSRVAGGSPLGPMARRGTNERELSTSCSRRPAKRAEEEDLPPTQVVIEGVVAPISAPPMAPAPRRTNLSPHPSSFRGREEDLQSIEGLLDDSRLVTLVGPGGAGKTRLASRYAAEALQEYEPGGAWFVELGEARSLAGAQSAVSKALSVPLTTGETESDGIELLGNAIAGRGRMLLVLDNFEQIVGLAPATIGRWLSRAPQARFLVTSRERLRLEGERVWEVGPLSTEDAAALFVDRARSARAGFEPAAGDHDAIRGIVEQVDRLPLAIELAAARASVMSPGKIKERLSERFRLLAAGRRDAAGRQATMMRAIDWSWDLLEGWEKEALAQLSVFRGGFTLEAAEAVLDISSWEDAPWVVDVVHALVDKSLVRRIQSPGDEGEVRLGLYESIRDYVARRLGKPAQVEARHGAFYARLGEEEALETLHGPKGVRAFRDLEEELDNLACAARRATARGEAETAATAALAASEVFELRGPFDLGRRLVSETLFAGPGKRLTGRLELRRGLLARLAGRSEESRTALGAALAVFRELGDRRFEGVVLMSLGTLLIEGGQVDEARAHYEAALESYRQIENLRGKGVVLGNLGILYKRQGRMEEARSHYDAALKIHRQIGHRRSEGVVLMNLGNLHRAQGRMEEARSHYDAALEIHREVGDRRTEGLVLSNLGILHHEQCRENEAQEHYEAALQIHREIGNRRSEGNVLGELGKLHHERGRTVEARQHYEAALKIHREDGHRRAEGAVLGDLGLLHWEQGRADEARGCFDTGEAILRAVAERIELGSLLCKRALPAASEGDRDTALRIAGEVEAISKEVGAGSTSVLGRLLEETRRRLSLTIGESERDDPPD